MIPIVFAAVISTMHLEADVTAANGDYLVLPFDVPAGTVEFDVARTVTPSDVILDFGVWAPDGFRGWGGGLTAATTIGVAESTRGYLPGADHRRQRLERHRRQGQAAGGHRPLRHRSDLPRRRDRAGAPARRPSPRRCSTRRRAGIAATCTCTTSRAATPTPRSTRSSRWRARASSTSWCSPITTPSRRTGSSRRCRPSLPDLLLVRGIEVTTYAGHGGALGASAYVDHRIGLDGRTAAQMIADVDAQGALFVVNHPVLDLGTACIGCAWKHDDTPWAMVSARGDPDRQLHAVDAALRDADARALGHAARRRPPARRRRRLRRSPRRPGHRRARRARSARRRRWCTRARCRRRRSSTAFAPAARRWRCAARTIRSSSCTTADGKRSATTPPAAASSSARTWPAATASCSSLVENGKETQQATVDRTTGATPSASTSPKSGERLRAQLTDGLDPIVVTSHLWLSDTPSSGCSMAPRRARRPGRAGARAVVDRRARSSPPSAAGEHHDPGDRAGGDGEHAERQRAPGGDRRCATCAPSTRCVKVTWHSIGAWPSRTCLEPLAHRRHRLVAARRVALDAVLDEVAERRRRARVGEVA